MFLISAITVLILFPLCGGAGLALFSKSQRSQHTALRGLLCLSLIPFFVFAKEVLTFMVSASAEYGLSLTLADFLRHAAPGIALTLGVCVAAVVWVRFSFAVVLLPLAVFSITKTVTLKPLQELGMLSTNAGEPYNTFVYDGLLNAWFLAFSVAGSLGLASFVVAAYWQRREHTKLRSQTT